MDTDKKNPVTEPADRSCDSKVWQESCAHGERSAVEDKHLCNTCGKIVGLDHEMHHEHFPHLSGDESKLH